MTTTMPPFQGRSMNRRRPRRAPRSRRGVAMLLVIVSMGAATILTTSYMVSRSNSPGIGQNATGAASASWSARSAADVAEAILQTNADWRSASADGELISNAALGGATVTVRVTDLEGNPPQEDDRDVIVTVEAIAGGLRAVEERLVNVRPDVPPEEAIDPGLNEYAAFATNEMRVDADGVVGVWPLSPAARSGRPAKIGSGFSDLSKLGVDTTACLKNVAFFPDADATSTLADMARDSRFADGEQVPLVIPSRPASLPAALTGLPVAQASDISIDPTVVTPDAPLPPGRYQKVQVEQGAVVTLGVPGETRAYSFDDLTVTDASALRIEGAVAIHLRGHLTIQNGSTVELSEASTGHATIFAARDVTVDRGGFGIDAALAQDPDVDWSSVQSYRHPMRLRIVSLDEASGGDASPKYELKARSLANAAIHAPNADFHVHDDSTLIGRVSGDKVHIQGGSALLYDPVLDRDVGLTARTGPLYDDSGQPLDGLQNVLNGLDPMATTEEIANTLSSLVTNPLGGDSGGGTASERDGDRATARIWPIRALALESDGGGSFTDIYDGAFLTIAGVTNTDDGSGDGSGTDDGSDSGGSTTDTSGDLLTTQTTISPD